MEFESITKKLYHHRNSNSIKNDFGKTLILGGSRRYPLSVVISASFATLSGTGFVSLGVPSSIYPLVVSKAYPTWIYEPGMKESDSLSYSEGELEKISNSYSSILFGNGIADTKENERVLAYLLSGYKGNLIVDATGLTLLKRIGAASFSGNVILTPHLGEAGRLFDMNIHSRNPEDYLSMAESYAESHSCYVLLKSADSILVTKDGEYHNGFLPTPSLAKAGSGDGLAGYLAGLLSYGTKDFSVTDLILFADLMIHKASYLSALKETDGLSDILSCIPMIKKIIQEGK